MSNDSPRDNADGHSSSQPEWTYLVNLDVTMWDRVHQHTVGSNERFEKLKQLVDQTKDGKSQLIVQVIDGLSFNPIYHNIDRYRFAQGKMERLSSIPDDLAEPLIKARDQATSNAAFKVLRDHGYTLGGFSSQGFAKDLQSLIETAPPEGRLALLNLSHGGGGAGFQGDNGYGSLTEVKDAITAGLKASHRDHLDFFDLDSCLTGDGNAMKVLAPVADTLIASQMPEFVDPNGSDTQPIVSVLKDALEHPPKDGQSLAHNLISETVRECTDGLKSHTRLCGTPSLAMYNSSASNKFFDALSTFSDTLRQAIKDPANRSGVESAISSSFSVDGKGSKYEQLRDLQSFAKDLSIGMLLGKIKDDSAHDIQKAIDGVSEAQKEFVPSYYGVLSALKGINVFLPSADFDPKNATDAEHQKQMHEIYANNMGYLPAWDAFIRDLHDMPDIGNE